MGRLYVVATPIGNLEDVSLRALRILGEIALVAAEDTRTAGVFLRRHGLKPRTISYTDHNKHERIPYLLQRLGEGDVALVSDAGTPAISDPGVDLVAAARAAGHEVVALPGPSAVVAALSVAGLRCNEFRFAGFMPRVAGEARRLLQDAATRPETLVAFEAPGRLRKTLQLIVEVLPERRIAVCRELTKLHEETFVGTAAEALTHFPAPRGEIVLVVEGGDAPAPITDEGAAMDDVREMKRLGLTRAQAQALIERRFGMNRRRFYELWVAADDAGSN
jgi:16S rRNA (cytidine1402-2'-O)-methyltransferase